jgi:hypothetical protein
MDSREFDRLARFIGTGQSRRRILRTFLGGGLGIAATAVGLERADAAARCRNDGVMCSKNADCCSAACLPKDRTGHRYCGEVCIPDGGACNSQNADSCCSGVCELTQEDTGFCCTFQQGPLVCGA